VITACPGADQAEESADCVIENLDWGYLQLGLVALALAGLQIWWISSVFKRRDLARPISEGEFRRSLERIESRKS
jgi:hypothetical protein